MRTVTMEEIEKIFNEVHSSEINLRKKLKYTNFKDELFVPNKKEWFEKRSIESISIRDFIDKLFYEASQKNKLDFITQTILFDDVDANDLGFELNKPIHIVDLFESIPGILKIL